MDKCLTRFKLGWTGTAPGRADEPAAAQHGLRTARGAGIRKARAIEVSFTP